jgi:hypothetical protein
MNMVCLHFLNRPSLCCHYGFGLTLQPAFMLAEHLVSCPSIVKLVYYYLTWSIRQDVWFRVCGKYLKVVLLSVITVFHYIYMSRQPCLLPYFHMYFCMAIHIAE